MTFPRVHSRECLKTNTRSDLAPEIIEPGAPFMHPLCAISRSFSMAAMLGWMYGFGDRCGHTYHLDAKPRIDLF